MQHEQEPDTRVDGERRAAGPTGSTAASNEAVRAVCPDCQGTGMRLYGREVSDGCDRCNATGQVEQGEARARDCVIYAELKDVWGCLHFDPQTMPVESMREAVRVSREALDAMLKGFEGKPFRQWCDEQWTDGVPEPARTVDAVDPVGELAKRDLSTRVVDSSLTPSALPLSSAVQPCPECGLSWDATVTTDCPLCQAQAGMLAVSEQHQRALPLSEQMREWLKDAWHKPYCRFGHMRWRIVGKHLVQDGQEDCTCGLSALLKE